MSTLELIWDRQTVYQLWSWDTTTVPPNTHYTAQLVRALKKNGTGSVYIVRVGARGTQPTDVIALKLARGKEEVEDMAREAGLYAQQLKHLQGSAVPKYYGFFSAKIGGAHLGCLLLEYCSGVPVAPERVPEFNRKALAAAYAVHAAGVLHGDLDDAHHFVQMDTDVRIVDFSVAVPHTCVRGVERRAQGHGRHHVCGCPELGALEMMFGGGW